MTAPAAAARAARTGIEVTGLSKRYGASAAVDNVSFAVQAGSVTGFLGPNGAGKSTTLRMMVGLTPPSAGCATILGVPYTQLPNPGRHVGVLLDASAQHAGRTGREILKLAAMVMDLPDQRADAMLELVGLTPTEARRRTGTYSLGMRQRLGVAHAMLGDPKVLILDEPANGLDPAGILVVIGRGKIVAQGSKQELLASGGTLARGLDARALAVSLTYGKFVDITQTPQKFLLPVLGILTITSEWSQRTGLVTFTLAPDRGRVLRAKAAATLLLGLVVIAVAFAAAAIGNALGAALRHGNGSWAFGAGGFRDITIVQLTGLAQGLALGMLLLIPAAAIVAYYVLPTLSSLLFDLAASLKGTKAWFDLNSAQSPLYTHDMTGYAWAQLAVAVLIWVALPAGLGVIRVLRSEVKSS